MLFDGCMVCCLVVFVFLGGAGDVWEWFGMFFFCGIFVGVQGQKQGKIIRGTQIVKRNLFFCLCFLKYVFSVTPFNGLFRPFKGI